MKMFDRRSLVSQIMIIFLLFNIFALTTFTFYITDKDRKSTIKNVEYSLQEIANEKAGTLSLIMGQVVKEAEGFANFTTDYIATETDTTLPPYYKKKASGILYREASQGSNTNEFSSVFFPADGVFDPNMIRMLNATEKLDKLMQSMMKRNPYIQWVYIATEDGFLRTYPYSSVDIFDSNHLQKNDPFYLIANPKNNPERKTVWTDPYVDYLDTGWMVTCTTPLYEGNQFVGVACIDVRLETIKKEFLKDFRLGEGGFVYLLENNGNVIYHPSIVPQGDVKGQTFLTNIVKDTNLDVLYKNALGKVINDESGVISYQDKHMVNHMIAHAKVEWQPWILGVEIIQNQYLQFNNLGNGNLWNFSLLLLMLYFLIAVFIYRQYSKPLNKLVQRAEIISEGDFECKDPIYNYTEIKTLSNAFNTMSVKMKDFTDSLIEKNNEIQNVIDGIGGMLMILSPDLDIVNMNKKAVIALGKAKAEIQGRKCYEVLAGIDQICYGCVFKQAIRNRSTQFCRILLKDDIFQNTYYPILDTHGDVSEIIVHSQRVTKRVMLENELSQSEKMSEIGQLTAAIAHELKNPLAIIKGSSYLLLTYAKKYKDMDIDESIDTIVQTTESAEKVIYNLLDFSNPASSQASQGNISKIVEQIILLTKRNATQGNIQINTEFEPDPLIYDGNAEPLKHVFMNLISNAINAMANGGTITIKGSYDSVDADQITLAVMDDGPGIDADIQKKIFTPFCTTDRSGTGSGMGLWITKIMVEKMLGTITLNSEKGKGTEFIITLPMTIGKGDMKDDNQ